MTSTTCTMNGMLFRVDDSDNSLRVDGMRLRLAEGESQMIGLVLVLRCEGLPVAFKLDEVGSSVYVMLTAYTRNVFNKFSVRPQVYAAIGSYVGYGVPSMTSAGADGVPVRRRRQRDRSVGMGSARESVAQMVERLKSVRCEETDNPDFQCDVCFSHGQTSVTSVGNFMCPRSSSVLYGWRREYAVEEARVSRVQATTD